MLACLDKLCLRMGCVTPLSGVYIYSLRGKSIRLLILPTLIFTFVCLHKNKRQIVSWLKLIYCCICVFCIYDIQTTEYASWKSLSWQRFWSRWKTFGFNQEGTHSISDRELWATVYQSEDESCPYSNCFRWDQIIRSDAILWYFSRIWT